MKKAPFPIIELIWVDSESEQEWKELKEVLNASKSLECRSIGYILLETDDRLILAASLGLNDDKNVSGHVTIPKVAIIERRTLETNKPKKKKMVINPQETKSVE